MSFNAKPNLVEADNVFVLMTNEYRVSRNIRAQWYFNNLNRTIELPNKRDLVSSFVRGVSWFLIGCFRLS